MITLHGRPNSSNVQKVLWALAELDLEHRLVERGGAHGGLDDPDFRQLTPFRRVPVIEDGEVVAFESNAILRHLGRTRSAGDLWPVDPAATVRAEAMMDWTTATLWPAIRPPFMAVAREGVPRDSEALGRQVAAVAEPLGMLQAALGSQPWLSGERFGFADIPAAVAMSRLAWLVGRRALAGPIGEWYGRCEAREAFGEVVYVDE